MVVKIRLLTWVHIKELLPGISPGEKTELQGPGVSGGCLKAVWRVSGVIYLILDILFVKGVSLIIWGPDIRLNSSIY